ncbi:MAG: hypothetical protein M1840_008756 [Geoglossum simile]|nr:MAG: hypothetical protein M1840_008756 [Geoglossum simile]
MEAWVQAIKVGPEGNTILEYNTQQGLEFRRWCLQDDPDSAASQDQHFMSAFTNRPIVKWDGEPGVLIIRNTAILDTPVYPDMDIELKEALRIFRKLQEGGEGDEGEDEGEEGEDEGEDEEDNEEDEEGKSDRGHAKNKEDQEGKEDERSEEDQSSSKARKTTHQNRVTRSTNRSGYSTTHNFNQKENKPNRRKSTLYDKSVPYSHREGYTFADCTANDLMRM